jgi:predicted MPP superfamily phosphohydrolase
MLKFFLTVIPLLAGDLWWWRQADRRLRPLGRSPAWRALLAAFMGVQIAYLSWLILRQFVDDLGDWRPLWVPTGIYIWHVLMLPAGCAWFIAGAAWRKIRSKSLRQRPTREPSGSASQRATPPVVQPRLSRRELMSAAAVAAPPLAAAFATRQAMAQMGEFRIRKIELVIPQLPADLDGLTIAHVTDLHIGRFMPPRLTGAMADATNALQCDLIAFTGDLIDASQRDVSPGIQFMNYLRPRSGMVMIEGNHDVVWNAGAFEADIKDAGLPLLLDEAMTFRIPGRTTPVQFLGTTWGELMSGRQLHRAGKERDYWFREYSNEARDASVRRVAAMREPAAFPILLAHHPHAFDAAATAGFPLVLSGHTHGGQIMLTHNIGAGPLRFRYWAGLYRKPGSQMFISNGIGSWFPLRVNAPSEIVKITLKRPTQASV